MFESLRDENVNLFTRFPGIVVQKMDSE
ncbi:hypothetical protein Godav_021009 [Gossypium davidsonii]|uniref:Uncharacterized protein n=1 Tax=Gossypium davidsonii TaxID=34287 RepID=A0A7J8R5J3_GOSDV|nr:hypothetical protein [Gossypium davidsonii]